MHKAPEKRKIFPTSRGERSREKQLEINVRADRKIVEVWLTNEDQQDQTLKEKLNPIYQQYREQKYTVAVFLSGHQDLAEETVALLRRSKRRSAELEVQRERKRRESMAR